ncbi:UDP-N-acetylglucosamine--N-acetylmuramyl-(pentapeptide) pyrophosphoryl-undecaprenol N-acetylglucosamine transferase [Nitrospira sp.]|nr:UDP-N-acetylglucosamine--N-acetylmuramyl-(pentapeptide) pyrophosphoryl-undecaprenol N-acetylglucosamine transferase [Nitrospira sp.]
MNIVIAAGGTGGHLYPAIALAKEFQQRRPGTAVLFVGTTRGIESRVVPHEGFPLRLITAKPFMGMGRLGALKALLVLPVGIRQAWQTLRAQRAGLVIGVGGYTTPAVLIAAWLARVPRVILEPNSYPGLANKIVGPFVDRVFLAFETTATFFPSTKVSVVGTPIRREFFEPEGAPSRGKGAWAVHLLIFGGSQGAKAINGAMVAALPLLTDLRDRLLITHQTGEADRSEVAAAYQARGFKADVQAFFFDMPIVLRAADLVIARSGAMTIAELTACGCPAVLIPLPQAIYNHQAKNAAVMEAAGAALVISQYELSGEHLAATIRELVSDPVRLQQMRERSASMRRIDAAARIVDECLSLVGEAHETNSATGATT